MKKSSLILIAFVVAFFAIGIYSYLNIEVDQIATHWNSGGEVNGYMNKFWGVFFMPLLSTGLMLLFLVIPKIDPMKNNVKKFRKYYDSFIVVFMAYMLYVYILSILANFDFEFNIVNAVLAGIGGLFVYLGFIMKNLRQNWFIGVRTPWTLSDEKVWKKTHELASKLFVLLGVIFLITIFLPENLVLFFILFPTIFVSVVLVFYSWFIWRRTK